MITTSLLYILWSFLWFLLTPIRLLPDASLSTNIISSITFVNGYITAFNPIFPIPTLLTVIAIVLSVEGGIFLYKIIMWVIRRIPGQG